MLATIRSGLLSAEMSTAGTSPRLSACSRRRAPPRCRSARIKPRRVCQLAEPPKSLKSVRETLRGPKTILRKGAGDLIRAVEAGQIALSRAAELCELAPEAQIPALQELAERKRHPRQKRKPAAVVKEHPTVKEIGDEAPSLESSPSAGRDSGKAELDPERDPADVAREEEAACASLMADWVRASNPARIRFIEELLQRWSKWGID